MSSNVEEIKKIINQSVGEILNDFKTINSRGYGGWHQFLGSEKVGNVATSQALLIINQLSVKFDKKHLAVKFLKENQIDSGSHNSAGGWAFISNVPGVANTESTCWALKALVNELDKDDSTITSGIKWLNDNFIHDGRYKGWGPTRKCGFRTYTTCIALETLKTLGLENDEFQMALDTLKRVQNDDGGWGPQPGTKSTLTHTSHVIITLINCGVVISTRAILTAVTWIVNMLKTKSYENSFNIGYSEMFDFVYENEEGDKIQRVNFYHMPIAYAINALIKTSYNDENLIHEAILNLMKQNDLGIWWHPLLLEKPLWAIFDVLSVFNDFLNSSFLKDFDNVHLQDAGKRKYDVIIFTVVPVEFKTLNTLLNFAPEGKKEDFAKRGFWYYEYSLNRKNGRPLNCLITMVGSAGDVGCYSACSTAFEEFDCDLAILCGIAAGNKDDIKKYSAVIGDAVVAYEFQRLEANGIEHRPRYFLPLEYTKRIIEKREFYLQEWQNLVSDFTNRCGVKLEEVENYSVEKTQLKAGAIAAGAKLIADGKTLEILKEKIPIGKGIIAAEMEGSGFSPCCIEYNKEWLVVRGISDYGEDDKDDPKNKEHQGLAVATAAATMIYYLDFLHRTPEEREQ